MLTVIQCLYHSVWLTVCQYSLFLCLESELPTGHTAVSVCIEGHHSFSVLLAHLFLEFIWILTLISCSDPNPNPERHVYKYVDLTSFFLTYNEMKMLTLNFGILILHKVPMHNRATSYGSLLNSIYTFTWVQDFWWTSYPEWRLHTEGSQYVMLQLSIDLHSNNSFHHCWHHGFQCPFSAFYTLTSNLTTLSSSLIYQFPFSWFLCLPSGNPFFFTLCHWLFPIPYSPPLFCSSASVFQSTWQTEMLKAQRCLYCHFPQVNELLLG